MIFKKNQILEKKYFFLISFYFIEFFDVSTTPQTLKGSQNIQGFFLIRVVWLFRLSIRK